MGERAKLTAKIGAGAVALLVPLVVYFEGKRNDTYADAGQGIITSCFGHTGAELELGQSFTDEQCFDQLYADLSKHVAALDCIKVPMTDGQKVAFISFSFNIGNRAFCGSTLARKANANDMRGACAELSRWTLAGGRELPGLVKRRAAERALCEGKAWKPV